MTQKKPLVCIVDSGALPLLTDVDVERSIFAETAEVVLVQMDDPERVPAPMQEAHGLIVGSVPRISRHVIAHLRQARIIVRNGVGYDNIDGRAARERGIPLSNVPDYCTEEVADHALALCLALQRKVLAAVAGVREGNWSWRGAAPVRRLRGQTFGAIGCGRIGTAVAIRAKAFGFQVGFYDPYVANGYEKALAVARFATLDALLESSDVVSLHAPLTAETRGMIGEGGLARMKPGSFLINTARGPLVQEKALIAALRAGGLCGVALDVLEKEPVFDSELLAHPNCLITPHMGFYSSDSMDEVRVSAARTVLAVLRGEAARNVVNGAPTHTSELP